MSKDSIIYEKSKGLAARILRLHTYLKKKGETSPYEVRESAEGYDADFANPLNDGGEPL